MAVVIWGPFFPDVYFECKEKSQCVSQNHKNAQYSFLLLLGGAVDQANGYRVAVPLFFYTFLFPAQMLR